MSVPEKIYIALLEEGIDVWRPVTAERVGPEAFRIRGPVPDGETWEFQPGEVVRCEKKKLSDGVHDVAVARLS